MPSLNLPICFFGKLCEQLFEESKKTKFSADHQQLIHQWMAGTPGIPRKRGVKTIKKAYNNLEEMVRKYSVELSNEAKSQAEEHAKLLEITQEEKVITRDFVANKARVSNKTNEVKA